MRNFLIISACLAMCLFAWADTFEKTNLCPNPSFESVGADGFATGWSGERSVYSIDNTVSHSEKNALKFVNDDPKRYVLCTQELKLDRDCFYEFSGWVKTQGVKGEDSGATFCMEWYGKAGYIGGAYPSGVKGDSDWKQVRGVTGRIPAEATRVQITCYLRKGMTGTAWFDDLELHRGLERPLTTVLLQPSYRGRVFAGGPQAVKIRATLNLKDLKIARSSLGVRAELLDADGKIAAAPEYREVSANVVEITLPALNTPPGQYTARVTLRNRVTNEPIAVDEYPITRLNDSAALPHSYIDEYHRLIIDGKPYFPLGMYWSGISEKDLAKYSEGPFNCLMPYGSPNGEQLDLAQKYGMKVIYSVKDTYAGSTWCPKEIKTEADEKPFITKAVEAHRDHPALLAWYLNDELPADMAERLNAHQTWVSELDPNHPTWVVLCNLSDVGKLTKSFDVIGTDPYPIPSPGPWNAGVWARETQRQVQGARAAWMVPQIFNWATYRKDEEENKDLRPPTLAEMRSMAWQCICEGATGLIFYSWFDIQKDTKVPFEEQWGYCKQMGEEIKQYFPVLLSIDAAPKVTVQGGGDWLHMTVRSFEGKTYLFAVNDGRGEGTATFTVAGAQGLVRVRDEHRIVKASDGSFSDHFDKLALHVYEIK